MATIPRDQFVSNVLSSWPTASFRLPPSLAAVTDWTSLVNADVLDHHSLCRLWNGMLRFRANVNLGMHPEDHAGLVSMAYETKNQVVIIEINMSGFKLIATAPNIYDFVQCKLSSYCAHCVMLCIKSFKCSRCEVAHYCSAQCQKKDWSSHRSWCKAAAKSIGKVLQKPVAEIPVRKWSRQWMKQMSL